MMMVSLLPMTRRRHNMWNVLHGRVYIVICNIYMTGISTLIFASLFFMSPPRGDLRVPTIARLMQLWSHYFTIFIVECDKREHSATRPQHILEQTERSFFNNVYNSFAVLHTVLFVGCYSCLLLFEMLAACSFHSVLNKFTGRCINIISYPCELFNSNQVRGLRSIARDISQIYPCVHIMHYRNNNKMKTTMK